MTTPNRRSFCKSALLPLAAAAALPLGSLDAGATDADATQAAQANGSRLRVSLNAFSFNQMLRDNSADPDTGIDLFGVCDFCAKLNFDAVDLTGYYFPGYPDVPGDDYIFRLKRHAFDLGLEISGTGVRNDFVVADVATQTEGIQRVKNWIEVAAKLGAPVIRVFAQTWPPHRNWRQGSGDADRQTVEAQIADAVRECADYGQKFGVIIGVQNHGDFLKTGEQHLSLIKKVNHPWCGPLVDTGRYISDDPYADIAMTAPYAVNWQIKTAMGTDRDAPLMDVPRLLTIIRKSGYRGSIPIETLAMKRSDYDPIVEVPMFLKVVRDAITATADIGPNPLKQ